MTFSCPQVRNIKKIDTLKFKICRMNYADTGPVRIFNFD